MGFDIDSVSLNEATSLHSIAGDWNQPVGDGDNAFSVSRLRYFIEKDSFRFGYVKRVDLHYQYANDTASLLYLTENKLPLPVNKSYELRIEANRSASSGFQVGYEWQLTDQFNLRSDISFLRPTELQFGYLRGDAHSASVTNYDLSFVSDLYYDEDPLYDRAAESISGNGFALDLAFDYQFDERWVVALELRDLKSQLNIPDAPHTRAQASSDNKYYDEQGYVVYEPLVRGREDYADMELNFEQQLHLDVRYNYLPQYQVSLQNHTIGKSSYRQVEWVWAFEAGEFRAISVPEYSAWGVGGRYKGFTAELVADSFDKKKIKLISLRLSWLIALF